MNKASAVQSAKQRPAGKLRALGASGKNKGSARKPPALWTLRLYIAGQTPKSMAALTNLRRLCDLHLPGKHRIEIMDLMKNPELAERDQIVVIPTLIRKLPEPLKRIIGDLSDSERAMVGLDLKPLAQE